MPVQNNTCLNPHPWYQKGTIQRNQSTVQNTRDKEMRDKVENCTVWPFNRKSELTSALGSSLGINNVGLCHMPLRNLLCWDGGARWHCFPSPEFCVPYTKLDVFFHYLTSFSQSNAGGPVIIFISYLRPRKMMELSEVTLVKVFTCIIFLPRSILIVAYKYVHTHVWMYVCVCMVGNHCISAYATRSSFVSG